MQFLADCHSLLISICFQSSSLLEILIGSYLQLFVTVLLPGSLIFHNLAYNFTLGSAYEGTFFFFFFIVFDKTRHLHFWIKNLVLPFHSITIFSTGVYNYKNNIFRNNIYEGKMLSNQVVLCLDLCNYIQERENTV